ncbi:PREDICTED: apoptosis regulatory protein Siva [Nipponia nippon]|nr:PREDICTED: apoptosis regulatory protein Siva [Nipponia nippon]
MTAESPGELRDSTETEDQPLKPHGAVNPPLPFAALPPVGVSKACSSCVRTADVKEACTQCDQFICQNCIRLCSCCNAVTCSLCSTIDYADVGEQVLCNGCSIFQV